MDGHTPLVLLGLRSAFKEDLQCTTAELVYGTTLRLPGEFFNTTSNSTLPDQHAYVSRLRNTMQHIQPVPTSHHATRSTHVSKDLSTCTHVFIRHNAILMLLQPPCDGPFKVIKRATKFYTILVNGHQQTISLDRLKPAHIDNPPSNTSSAPVLPAVTPTHQSSPLPRQQPARHTRSGRHVHFPDRYVAATYQF